jgi:hypothetical protein
VINGPAISDLAKVSTEVRAEKARHSHRDRSD